MQVGFYEGITQIHQQFQVTPTPPSLVEERVNGLRGYIGSNSLNKKKEETSLAKVRFNGVWKDVSKQELFELAHKWESVDCRNVPFVDNGEIQNFIARCIKLKEFKIKSDKLIELTNLPNTLEKLDCSSCNSLNNLSLQNLSALKSIFCQKNSSLKRLKLKNLERLETVNFSRCSSLTEVTFVNLPHLVNLSFSYCILLEELPLNDLTTLQKVEFRGCTQLELVGSARLPHCNYLDFRDCPALLDVPEWPVLCTVFTDRVDEFITYTVDPDELNNDPLEVLCSLGRPLLNNRIMPNIAFRNQLGVDAGGLKRQLVTTLMNKIFTKEFGLPLIDDENNPNFGLPLITNPITEKQAMAFRTIGALIGLAAIGSQPLGECLNAMFYAALLSLSRNEVNSVVIGEPLSEILKTKIYLSINPDKIDELTEGELDDNQSLYPVALAAKEFKNIVGDKRFEEYRNSSLNNFILRVEGKKVIWENFLEAVMFDGDQEDVTKGYFQSFFEEYKGTEKLADMIELFTGSRAFKICVENDQQKLVNIHICVKNDKDKEHLFVINTCLQIVTIPRYHSYQTFKDKFFKTFWGTERRFDLA